MNERQATSTPESIREVAKDGHEFYEGGAKGTGESYQQAGLPSPRQAVLDATYVLNKEIPLNKVHDVDATRAAMEVIEANPALKQKLNDRKLLGEVVEEVQSKIKSEGHLYKLDLPDEDIAKLNRALSHEGS